MKQTIGFLLLLLHLLFVGIEAGTGNDVDGKPLVAELADQLKTCDEEGPKMPEDANKEEPKEPEEEKKEPEEEKKEPEEEEKKEPEEEEKKEPKTPEKKTADCKNDYPECNEPDVKGLCLSEVYSKMMQKVCRETCETCDE